MRHLLDFLFGNILKGYCVLEFDDQFEKDLLLKTQIGIATYVKMFWK